MPSTLRWLRPPSARSSAEDEELLRALNRRATRGGLGSRDSLLLFLPQQDTLTYNNLTGLPEEMAGLTSLRRLDVSWNRMQRFPAGVGQLRALETLELWGNDVLKALPEDIGAASKLQRLNVAENEITGKLPDSIGALRSLVRLDLSSNRVEQLPKTIGALVNLEYLDLGQRRETCR
jgi:Leucine-rich repeat (LRR) protein